MLGVLWETWEQLYEAIGLVDKISADFSSFAKTMVLVYDWLQRKLSLQIIHNYNDLSLPNSIWVYQNS